MSTQDAINQSLRTRTVVTLAHTPAREAELEAAARFRLYGETDHYEGSGETLSDIWIVRLTDAPRE